LGRNSILTAPELRLTSLEVWTIALKDNMIVAGCENGQIKTFKLNESQDVWETQSEPSWRGHSGFVTGMAFSADGQWLISGSQVRHQDKTIRLWDARPGGTVVSAV
jgi:WD40 repeat protein